MANLPIIPIMMCFNDNYAIPAGVAIYSILANSSKDYKYEMHILHSDITESNQQKLIETVKDFSNVSLNFINMQNRFADLFDKSRTRGHFSKEMYYKFLPAEIFPQYEKIIITDVDVVFINDISKLYEEFNVDDDYYLSASKQVCHKNRYNYIMSILKDSKLITKEEIDKTRFDGGFYIFNLKKMREDNIVPKFISYAQENIHRLTGTEQDTISMVCYPKIKQMAPNALVCSNSYDMYKKQDYYNDVRYSASEVINALENPIQLHYGGRIKPWNDLTITKADIWYKYLVQTAFCKDQINKIGLKLKKPKKLFKIQCRKLRKVITCYIDIDIKDI